MLFVLEVRNGAKKVGVGKILHTFTGITVQGENFVEKTPFIEIYDK